MPVAQRRHLEFDHVEAVIEVLAEPAGRHLLLQVAVGGDDDAHVHADRLLAADPLQFVLLEHAQQLGLHGRRGLADLVEEQGAAVGLDEAALAAAVGAGEGAPLVAEQLGFEQGFGERGTVHLDKRPAAPQTLVVQGRGHQFLAGAGLAVDEHGRLGGGHVDDQVPEGHHGRGRADDAAVVAERLARLLHGLLLLAMAHGHLQGGAQPVKVQRLGQVIVGALLDGGHGRVHR